MRFGRAVRSIGFVFLLLLITGAAFAQVGVGINITLAPPALPVYEQPLCPGDGYIWNPGYWAWGDDGYYWVPGTWVEAPEVGYLWTPPWWGWEGGYYVFHTGYWGPHVGFYGGINYGFGYFGTGFVGGRWQGDHFFYNQSVTRINVVNIHNVYNERVEVRNDTHVAYNGGRGGIEARPSAAEEAAARDRHIDAVAAQREHMDAARSNPDFRASTNHGRPAVMATDRPGNFRGGASAADNHGGNASFVHPKDMPVEHMDRPNTGNAKLDQKYQKQQAKFESQQEKERNNLQKQQDKEHAQMQKQQANAERQQQTEQRHQQQTQQMAQRHTQQRQTLQSKQVNTHGAAPREGKH